jgi:uncharacterized membrane protein
MSGQMGPAPQVPPDPPRQAQNAWISMTLLGGVLLAAVLILLGLLLLLIGPAQPGEPATVAELIAQQAHATSLSAILDGVATGRPTALIRLGVLVLVLTPATRVLLTLLLFLRDHDWAFVLITSIVLAVLALGLLGLTG